MRMRKLGCFFALFWAACAPAQPPASVWKTYHDHAALSAALKELAAKHPGFLKLESIGKSVQGRDIWLATVTNGKREGPKRAVLLDAAMHGGEVIGSESMLSYLRFLLEKRVTDPQARRIVDEFVTYVIPMVNPDGVEAGKTSAAHGAARCNAHGVDINRNFGWNWKPGRKGSFEFSGEEAFSEPEARILRDQFRGRDLLLYLNVHSGTEGEKLIRPSDAPDSAYQEALQQCVAKLTPFARSFGPLAGSSRNWAYWTAMGGARERGLHPLSFTLETYAIAEFPPNNNPKWWCRYNPPSDKETEAFCGFGPDHPAPDTVEGRIEKVRRAAVYLTLATAGETACPVQ